MVAYIKKLAIKKNNWLNEEPTCMIFAVRVVEGAKDHTSCPILQGGKEEALAAYLSQFQFD